MELVQARDDVPRFENLALRVYGRHNTSRSTRLVSLRSFLSSQRQGSLGYNEIGQQFDDTSLIKFIWLERADVRILVQR